MTDTVAEANKTCEDRIESHLAARIGDLTEIIEAIDNDGGEIDANLVGDSDDAMEYLDNFALAIEVRTTMIVQISTGGPGDQFEIEVVKGDYGWELADSSATYRFLDWFDGATRRTDDLAVMRYLSAMVERLSY